MIMSTNLEQELKRLGIAVQYKFLPKSHSRNREERMLSINWLVTLKKCHTNVITLEYTQNILEHPLWRPHPTQDEYELIANSVEIGSFMGRQLTPPEELEFAHKLIEDTTVLNYADYEMWAEYMGYEEDSHEGRIIYNESIRIALIVRYYLGSELLDHLHRVFNAE